MVRNSYFLQVDEKIVDITDEQYIILINRLDESRIFYDEICHIKWDYSQDDLKLIERSILISNVYSVELISCLLGYIEKNTEI